MSKAWSRHSFRAAEPAETVVRLNPEAASGPKGFAPEQPVTWENADGFVRKGEGFAPAADYVCQPRRDLETLRAAFVPSAAYGQQAAEPEIEPDADDEPEAPVADAQAEAAPINLVDESAVAEAFAAGYAEGEKAAHATLSGQSAACARLIVGLTGSDRFDRGTLAQRLQQTVLHLVRQMVGEIQIPADRLAARIDHAVSMLADVTEPARVHLHPDDFALIGGHLPSHVATVSSPQIERGGFRLETLSATVEDGPTLWMEQLGSALDKVPLDD